MCPQNAVGTKGNAELCRGREVTKPTMELSLKEEITGGPGSSGRCTHTQGGVKDTGTLIPKQRRQHRNCHSRPGESLHATQQDVKTKKGVLSPRSLGRRIPKNRFKQNLKMEGRIYIKSMS